MTASLHEDLTRETEHQESSDRNFGFVVGGAFAALGLVPLLRAGHVRIPLVALGAILAALAAVRPALLKPLNRAWTALGLLMGRIVTPVVTTILFGVLFVPVGLFLRLSGKDLLRLKFDPSCESYWIVREPAGSEPQSMTKQF